MKSNICFARKKEETSDELKTNFIIKFQLLSLSTFDLMSNYDFCPKHSETKGLKGFEFLFTNISFKKKETFC